MYFLMACSDDPLRSFRLSMALATITAAGGWAGGALFLGAFSSAIVQWVEWYACARTDSDKDNDSKRQGGSPFYSSNAYVEGNKSFYLGVFFLHGHV